MTGQALEPAYLGPRELAEQVDPTPFLAAESAEARRIGRFNLAIVGNSGVGKSSLVNAIFGDHIAQTGTGLPVTSGIHYYQDGPLGIWDFEGFEIGSKEPPAQQLARHLAEIAAGPPERRIAVVWYCVLAAADRITPADVEMIQTLDAAGLPVVLVLTKVEARSNVGTLASGKKVAPQSVARFQEWLENPTDQNGDPITLPIELVAPTAALGRAAPFGLADLLTGTLDLSGSAQDALIVAQRLNAPMKRKAARSAVTAAVAAAVAAAAIPIPVADAVVLAPIQMSMMGRVAAVYGLEVKRLLSQQGLAQLATQMTGRALARSFLKLIPGAGSVVSASVAGALTGATGEAWIRFCEAVAEGKVNLDRLDEEWGRYSPSVRTVLTQAVSQAERPNLPSLPALLTRGGGENH